MNAIKKVRKYMLAHPGTESTRILGRLVAALAEEQPFPLSQLYALDMDSFELAMELMSDWRLDRYYASRIKLLDTVLAELPELNT